MFRKLRQHTETIVVAMITAAVTAAAPAVAHGVHAAFAHNADKVDGYHANQLVRASYKATVDHIDDFSSGTFTSIVSKDVKAPKKGILLITATFNAEWDATSAANTAALLESILTVNGATLPGYGLPVRHEVLDHSEAADIWDSQSVTLLGAKAVSKGTHNVALQVRRSSGTALTHIERGFITVLYVPFGNAGTAGVLSPVREASGNSGGQ